MTPVKYPKITVKLTGTDGNAFALLGKVKTALTRNGVERAEVDLFLAQAMSGDYNNLLRTCVQWVVVE